MTWYSGTTTEAIAESKSLLKLFVVYIEGDDEDSKKMNAVWETADVLKICQSQCICLKLKSDSVDCKQFAEFYPVLIIPCTYMISNGVPLDIVGGFANEKLLIEKLKKSIQALPVANSNAQSSSQSSFRASTSGGDSVLPSARTSHVPAASTTTPPPHQNREDSENINQPDYPPESAYSDDDVAQKHETVESGSFSMDDKVKKLQEKIKQQREEKSAEFEKKERMKEIARRTTGKQVQEMKEKHKDVKMKLEIAERKKEKALQQEALERVRADIARDRAEKKQKFEAEIEKRNKEKSKLLQEKAEEEQREKEEMIQERNKTARIQFRFPDGTAMARKYDSSVVFRVCVDDLRAEAPPSLPRDFELFTTIPNHVFGSDDMDKQLNDLSLVPSATIYVRPTRATVLSRGEEGIFSKLYELLWLIVSLPMSILEKVWGFFTASPPNPPAPASPDSTNNSDTTRTSTLRRRKPPSRNETSSDRNVRRLHDVRDDDDDVATWNGNSTQQM